MQIFVFANYKVGAIYKKLHLFTTTLPWHILWSPSSHLHSMFPPLIHVLLQSIKVDGVYD